MRPRIRAWGLLLAFSFICVVRAADTPIEEVIVDEHPPDRLEYIMDDLQANLEKLDSRPNVSKLSDEEKVTVARWATNIVTMLNNLLTKREDEALRLYDDDDFRGRLGEWVFPEAIKSEESLTEEGRRKQRLRREEQKPIIADRILRGRPWPGNEKSFAAAKVALDALIVRVKGLAEKRRSAAVVRDAISRLYESPERREFALGELRTLGPEAVPVLVDMFLKTKVPEERKRIVEAMGLIGVRAIPPLVAALDANDEALELAILDVFRRRYPRYNRLFVPDLWYPSASKKEAAAVRAEATKLLSDLLGRSASELPPAAVALTREAERYFKGDVRFTDPNRVTVWRWDETAKGVVNGWPGVRNLSPRQAEEYYGTRFARQALLLDPSDRAAQEVLIGLAVEGAVGKDGTSDPLVWSSPAVAELVRRTPARGLVELLERAIRERRTGLTLALVGVLGDRSEPAARQSLAKALYYPSPRVQQAAAEAMIRAPGTPRPGDALRVVAVLGRALAPEADYVPGPKILVAVGDEDRRDRVEGALLRAGDRPVLASNHRDAMRHLRKGGEIQAILLDSTLPGAGLAQTLAQMRKDVDVAHLPILLAAVPATPEARACVKRYREIKAKLEAVQESMKRYRDDVRKADAAMAAEVRDAEKDFALDKKANRYLHEEVIARIREKREAELLRLREAYPRAASREPQERRLLQQLAIESKLFALEVESRKAALERFVRGFARVLVVRPSVFTDESLTDLLLTFAEAGERPPTTEEKRRAADRAIAALGALADGVPAGYDVMPVAAEMLAALREGRVGERAQESLVKAAAKFPGELAQRVLAIVALDGRRPIGLRGLAVDALIRNVQTNGPARGRLELRPFAELAATPGLLPDFARKVNALLGVVGRGTPRSTGEMLRDYRPKEGK